MNKTVCFWVIFAVLMLAAVGNAFAPLVMVRNDSSGSSSSSSSSSGSGSSTVDLSDKDTSKPVRLLR